MMGKLIRDVIQYRIEEPDVRVAAVTMLVFKIFQNFFTDLSDFCYQRLLHINRFPA